MKSFEVLVCDDGSAEDIASVVKSFNSLLDIRYYRLERSGGPARPRNVGIAHASYEWISFLDSDDWWSRDRIEVVSHYLSNDVDLLYHKLKIVRNTSDGKWPKPGRVKFYGRAIEGDPLTDMLSRGNPLPTSSVTVRKSLLDKIGGMNENKLLKAFEDFDAWLSMASHGARFLFIERALGYYYVGSDNISVISDKQIDSQKTTFERHTADLPDELADWAKSYNNYIVGTYLLYLGRSKDALVAFRDADNLRDRSQRFKRLVKMVVAAMRVPFMKKH
jgi:glycosyltransferase involved in cell wall biosynthesis